MSKLTIKPKTITLRPRRDSDEAFLRKAYESSREEELEHVLWENSMQRQAFLDHQFNAQDTHLKNFYTDLEYHIIESEGKPIGRLALEWQKDHLHIVDLIIITEFRKQRIGSAIMEAIISEVDKRGISSAVMYEKWKPYNEKFYETYGFKTTKEYPMHFYMEREKKLKM